MDVCESKDWADAEVLSIGRLGPLRSCEICSASIRKLLELLSEATSPYLCRQLQERFSTGAEHRSSSDCRCIVAQLPKMP